MQQSMNYAIVDLSGFPRAPCNEQFFYVALGNEGSMSTHMGVWVDLNSLFFLVYSLSV